MESLQNLLKFISLSFEKVLNFCYYLHLFKKKATNKLKVAPKSLKQISRHYCHHLKAFSSFQARKTSKY